MLWISSLPDLTPMIITVNVTSCVSQWTLILLHWLKVMLSNVFHVLTKNKASGPDGLWGCVLKVCAFQLGHFLLAFFSGSLIFILGQVPWKCLQLRRTLKNLVLNNSMTSNQWHSHQSLLCPWRDLFAVSWSHLCWIAWTPYSLHIESECNFDTFQSDFRSLRHFWTNCPCVLYGFFISFQHSLAPCSQSEAIEPWD